MAAETKRKAVHFPSWTGGLCGARAAATDQDTDPAKVTCRKCIERRKRALAKLKKKEARAAMRKAESEADARIARGCGGCGAPLHFHETTLSMVCLNTACARNVLEARHG